MTRPLPLRHNYELKLPGYSCTFRAPQMQFLPAQRALQVHTEQGDVVFAEGDKLLVLVMDLDIPTYVRDQMLLKGWSELPIGQLVSDLAMDYIFM